MFPAGVPGALELPLWDSGRSGAVQFAGVTDCSDFLTLCALQRVPSTLMVPFLNPLPKRSAFHRDANRTGSLKRALLDQNDVNKVRMTGECEARDSLAGQVCCSGVSPAGCSIVPKKKAASLTVSPVTCSSHPSAPVQRLQQDSKHGNYYVNNIYSHDE